MRSCIVDLCFAPLGVALARMPSDDEVTIHAMCSFGIAGPSVVLKQLL